MKWLQRFKRKSGVFGEFLQFLWRAKMWWLIPLIVVLTLLILVLIFAGSSPIAPFIYPLI